MLIAISFPVVDYREMLTQETAKIDLQCVGKNWNQDVFLRSFGQLSQRKGGGPAIPENEYLYANAHRAVRFVSGINPGGAESRHSQIVFRRVFFNRYCVRLDIGIHAFPCTERDLSVPKRWKYICECINHNVAQVGSGETRSLIKIGQDFAQHYLMATSIHGKETDKSWTAAGSPVIVAECEMSDAIQQKIREDSENLEKHGMYRADVIPSDWEGIELIYTTYGINIPVWILMKGEKAQRDKVRALRIFLLKWHQEREAFKYLAGFLSRKNIEKDLLDTDKVAEVLDEILKDLLKKKRNGIIQDRFWAIINRANEFVCPYQGRKMQKFVKSHAETRYLEKRVGIAVKKSAEKEMMKKTVFISYTWEDEKYKKWVKRFADALSKRGIQTVLDQNDVKLGQRLTGFMERLAACDYVLFLCTPKYKERSDKNEGGVGYEKNLITGEIYQKMNEEKFIPILTKGDWKESMPVWSVGKLGINLSDGKCSGPEFKKLIDTILGL